MIFLFELGLIYKCETCFIQYVFTWDRMIMRSHNILWKSVGVDRCIELYIQYIALKKLK